MVWCGVQLINAERLNAGKKPIGFLNQIIYQLAASNPLAFNDVTSGTNNCAAGAPGQQTCCTYGFTAAKGLDPLTGWVRPPVRPLCPSRSFAHLCLLCVSPLTGLSSLPGVQSVPDQPPLINPLLTCALSDASFLHL